VGLLRGLILLGETTALAALLELLNSPDYTARCSVLHSLEGLELSAEDRSHAIAALEGLSARETTRAVQSTLGGVLEKLRTADLSPR
jgi:hypothetical protein